MEQVAAFLTNALLYIGLRLFCMTDVDLRGINSVPHLLRWSSRLAIREKLKKQRTRCDHDNGYLLTPFWVLESVLKATEV